MLFKILFTFSAIAVAPIHGDYDWIQQEGRRNPITGEFCCGKNDCVVIPNEQVEFDGSQHSRGVWIIKPTREKIPAIESQPSTDGKYWRCHMPTGKRRCFFYPPASS